jgi:hypothetical protein
MRVILDLDTLKSIKYGIVYVAFSYDKHWYDYLDKLEQKAEVVKVFGYYDTLMRHLGLHVSNRYINPVLVWIYDGVPVCFIQDADLKTIHRITNNYIHQ